MFLCQSSPGIPLVFIIKMIYNNNNNFLNLKNRWVKFRYVKETHDINNNNNNNNNNTINNN